MLTLPDEDVEVGPGNIILTYMYMYIYIVYHSALLRVMCSFLNMYCNSICMFPMTYSSTSTSVVNELEVYAPPIYFYSSKMVVMFAN